MKKFIFSVILLIVHHSSFSQKNESIFEIYSVDVKSITDAKKTWYDGIIHQEEITNSETFSTKFVILDSKNNNKDSIFFTLLDGSILKFAILEPIENSDMSLTYVIKSPDMNGFIRIYTDKFRVCIPKDGKNFIWSANLN